MSKFLSSFYIFFRFINLGGFVVFLIVIDCFGNIRGGNGVLIDVWVEFVEKGNDWFGVGVIVGNVRDVVRGEV